MNSDHATTEDRKVSSGTIIGHQGARRAWWLIPIVLAMSLPLSLARWLGHRRVKKRQGKSPDNHDMYPIW